MRIAKLAAASAMLVVMLAAGCSDPMAEMPVDQLLAEGWMSFSTGDFEISRRYFAAAEARPGTTPEQKHSAILGLATAHQLDPRPDMDAADAAFQRLGDVPTEGARRDSLMGLGQVELGRALDETKKPEERIPHLALARGYFLQVLADYPDSLAADQAVIHIAETYLTPFATDDVGGFELPDLEMIARAEKAVEARLEVEASEDMAAATRVLLGRIQIALGKYGEAVENLKIAEPLVSVPRIREGVVWQIANLSEARLNDTAQAIRYYQLFVDSFERSTLNYRAQLRVERLSQSQSNQPQE